MAETQKIAITGAGGRLGGALVDAYQRRAEVEVLALSRAELDLAEPTTLESILEEHRFAETGCPLFSCEHRLCFWRATTGASP